MTLEVLFDRAVDLPTQTTLGGAACAPTRTDVRGRAFACPLTVTASAPEGPVTLLVSGVVARAGAKLPTVNETYTNVWPSVIADPADPDDVGTPNVPVVVDVTPPVFETLATRAPSPAPTTRSARRAAGSACP